MDVSQENIKQCGKATEIQALRMIWCTGDYFWDKLRKRVVLYSEVGDLRCDYEIWLPRQDQLQEMIYGDAGVMCCVSLAQDIAKFGRSLGHKHIEKYQFHSMEQLWLAFVMKERYNKVWLNGEWVNESK